MKPLASRVRPTAYGARSACETRKSWPLAALPPTWVVMPSPGAIARICGDQVGRVGLRRRQRADGVEPDGRAADVLGEQGVETGRALAGGQRVQRGDLLGRQERAGRRIVDDERALDPVDAAIASTEALA